MRTRIKICCTGSTSENFKCCRFGFFVIFLFVSLYTSAGDIVIKNNPVDKTIIFGNSKITITLDYNGKCNIPVLNVNGQSVLSGPSGIFSEIKTSTNTYLHA